MDELDLEDLKLAFHLCLIVLFKLLDIHLILLIIGKVILSRIVDDVVIIIYNAARLVMRIINDNQACVIDVFINRVFKEQFLLFVTYHRLHSDVTLYLDEPGLSFMWQLACFLHSGHLLLILLFYPFHLLTVCFDHFGDLTPVLPLHLPCEFDFDLLP